MIIGVPKEICPGEKRVALIPQDLPRLTKKGITVVVERGAGVASGFADDDYEKKGAQLIAQRDAVVSKADFITVVRGDGAAADFVEALKGKSVFGFFNPLGEPQGVKALAHAGATVFAVELVPRITRAQSMDALSSMANIAGYRAVLMASTELAKVFPMMMTAAGTLKPTRVFVLGAGVAGLQAIATAKRLGAIVQAYDVRPEVKDQVQSVGGEFVTLDLETEGAGDSGGYAKEQSGDFLKRQQAELAKYIRANDVIITTAAIPGRKAPLLITEAMMEGMPLGSVVVDLAAETGGNCAVTQVGKTIMHHGVKVIGPINVPSAVAHHASQMYSRNVVTFVDHVTDDQAALHIDLGDEIIAGCLVARGGEVVHERVKGALGL